MNAPLGKGALGAYGLLTLPLAIAGLPLALHVPPFYTAERGLDLSMVGLVLMVARISDVLTDPFIGALSDRHPTRWGRRRPWILAGMPLMVFGTWQVFVPPTGAGPLHLLIWVSILYLGWTMVSIPYAAWGAELSADYHERSRVTAVREVFMVVGFIVAGIVPAVAGAGGGGLGTGLYGLAVMTVVLLPIATLLLVATVPETPLHPTTGASEAANLRTVWRNGPFRRLWISVVLGGLAQSINQTLAVLFYAHVLRMPAQAGLLILVYFVAGVAAVPFWVRMSARWSKHRALAISGLWGCAWFLLTPLVPPERFWPIALITLMTGSVMAVPQVLGGSMAADVVDLDAARTGKQRAALFFALWGMGSKAALALGVGIALPVLDWFGFQAAGQNGPTELRALTAMYCVVPVALWLTSITLIWGFPITPARQARLRARFERRAARVRPTPVLQSPGAA